MIDIKLNIKPLNCIATFKEFALLYQDIFGINGEIIYCLNSNSEIVKGTLYPDGKGNLRYKTNYDTLFNPIKFAFCENQLQ